MNKPKAFNKGPVAPKPTSSRRSREEDEDEDEGQSAGSPLSNLSSSLDGLMGGDEDFDSIVDSTASGDTADSLLQGYDLSAIDDLAEGRMPESQGASEQASDLLEGYDLSAIDSLGASDASTATEDATFQQRQALEDYDRSGEMNISMAEAGLDEDLSDSEDTARALATMDPTVDEPDFEPDAPRDGPRPEVAIGGSRPEYAGETTISEEEAYPDDGSSNPVYAMPLVDAEMLGGEDEEPSEALATSRAASGPSGAPSGQEDPTTAPRDPAAGLADPVRAEGEDAQAKMWDERIARLEQLRDSARSAETRRIIGRMITSAIGGASRYLSGMAGNRGDQARRSYERPWGEQSPEEQGMPQLLADQGAEWEAHDQLRDRTAMEAERMRQQASAQDMARTTQEDALQTSAMRRRQMGATADRTDQQRQQEMDERDPQSGRSDRSAEAFRMSASTLPADVQAAFADRLATIDDLSAQEINELSADIHHFAQGRLARRDGVPRPAGRGGGGAGSNEAIIAATRARVALLRQHGLVDEEQGVAMVEGMSSPNRRTRAEISAALDDLSQRLPARATATQRAAQVTEEDGHEILPGVRVRVAGMGVGEYNQVRRAYDMYAGAMQDMAALEQLANQPNSLVDPRIRRQIDHRMVGLRSLITRIQETGIIQMGERHLIDAELPNPNQVTQRFLENWRDGLRTWRSMTTERALGSLRNRGATQEELQTARQLLSGRSTQQARPQGGQAPQGGQPPGTIRVRSLSTDRIGFMTQEQFDAANRGQVRFERQ